MLHTDLAPNSPIKIFAISLSSQPFLGRHFLFHIFFHNDLLGDHIFLQMGYFELDMLYIQKVLSSKLFNIIIVFIPVSAEN